MRILFLLVMGAIIVFSDGTGNSEPREITPFEVTEAYASNVVTINDKDLLHFDAEKLLNAYADNAYNVDKLNRLDKLSKDKWIKLSGVIHKVHNDYIDGCWVTIRQKRKDGFFDGWMYICLNFKSDFQASKVVKMKSGDKITILGYCTGNEGNWLNIEDCYLR